MSAVELEHRTRRTCNLCDRPWRWVWEWVGPKLIRRRVGVPQLTLWGADLCSQCEADMREPVPSAPRYLRVRP